MASYLLDAPRLIGWVHVLSLLIIFLGRLPLRWSHLQSMGVILSTPFHATMNTKCEGTARYLACSINETVTSRLYAQAVGYGPSLNAPV